MLTRNLSLLTDFYELTMVNGYFQEGQHNQIVVFDLFYRSNPSGSAFSIAAGLEQVIHYINNLHFDQEDIAYLRDQGLFDDSFLTYLSQFKFTGDLYAVPEGTVVFPNEPLIKVIAPIFQAQLIESALLNIINHQSLIATKAARVKWAVAEGTVLEFGLRRAQGPDAAIYGARAAVIGGCAATSNVLAGKMFGIPVKGTHAHSWIMSFDSELEAFRTYASIYPDACILLVDTYDTLKSGMVNAIKVFDEMKAAGIESKSMGIRLDSGDLAYLSKKARIMLDEAGHENAIISASSDLDEYLIGDLKLQGAKITLWGVGTNLITSRDCPSFGGVYKLAAIKKQDEFIPKIKISENPGKITNPGNKKILRLYHSMTHKIIADLIALDHEIYNPDEDLLIFDPIDTWKKQVLKGGTYTIRELLVPIYKKGALVYPTIATFDIKAYCEEELTTLWDESRRLINPQEVYVDLSRPLYNLKMSLLTNQ